MKLRINGEDRDVTQDATVGALLHELGITTKGIAVELNREIIPRGAHDKTRLKDGDTIEIVRMTGGG